MATPDLLAGLSEEKPDPATLDLLSQITEDDGTAWMPWSDDDQPVGVQGTVQSIGTVDTDPKYGAIKQVPLVSFVDSEGTVWSIRGYGKAVNAQIQGCIAGGMKPGDVFAAKYLGEKDSGAANPYHNVKCAFAPVN